MADLIIPEMQKVKEKYPEYKDTPDVALLNSIVRKYPVYKPIADRVGQEIRDTRKKQAESVSPLAQAARAIMSTSVLNQMDTAYAALDYINETPKDFTPEQQRDYVTARLKTRELNLAKRGTIAQFEDPMALGIMVGMASTPIATAKVLGLFAGLEQAAESAGINDKIKNIPNATSRDVVDLAKFGIMGALAGGLSRESIASIRKRIQIAGKGKPIEVVNAAIDESNRVLKEAATTVRAASQETPAPPGLTAAKMPAAPTGEPSVKTGALPKEVRSKVEQTSVEDIARANVDALKKLQKEERLKLIREVAQKRQTSKSGVFPLGKVEEASKLPARSVEEPSVNGLYEVKMKTPVGEVTQKMTMKRLLDLEENTKNPESKLKILDKKLLSSDEAGSARLIEELKGVEELRNKLEKTFDVEAPLKRVGAPETGFELKTYMSKAASAEEKAIKAVLDMNKFGLSREDFGRLAFAAEDAGSLQGKELERLGPAIKQVRNFFDSYFEKLNQRIPERFQNPWPHSRISRNEQEINVIKDALFKRPNETVIEYNLRRASLMSRMSDLENENAYLSQLKYVHIPLRLWFEDVFKDRADFKSIIGRKSPSLRAFVDEGYIKPEQVDVRDMMANYARYVESQLAMQDIIDAGKAEGLIHSRGTKGTEDWVNPPSKIAGFLPGYKVHPALADAVESYFGNIIQAGSIGRVLATVKMFQFYNPIILPMYNVYQQVMSGSIKSGMDRIAVQAFQDIVQRSPEYFKAYDNGLFSQPYNNPYESFIKDLAIAKQGKSNATFIEKALKRANEYQKNPKEAYGDIAKLPGQLYSLSWNTAWKMDKFTRMTAYRTLMEKGLSSRDAAQTVAKFFGDYAGVPPKTRKLLNKILFTPTFEISTNKLYMEMIKSAVNVTRGKDKSEVGKRFAKGLLYTSAIVIGYDQFMTRGLGFERQDFGRRYYKNADTDEGPKEVVVTLSNPANMWLRYWYDLSPNDLPTNMWDKASRFIGNRAHPILRLPFLVAANSDEVGNEVYNPFDPLPIQLMDQGKFILSRTVRATELIPGMASNEVDRKKAYQALLTSTNLLTAQVVDKLAFTYIRNIKSQRDINAIKNFQRMYKKAVKINMEDIDPKDLDGTIKRNVIRTQLFIRHMNNFIQKEYGDEHNGYSTSGGSWE